MTYDVLKARFGRIPATYVEIDIPSCSLVYGTAPCTAAVGVTGTAKCFNTRKTCQDAPNFAPAPRTWRFGNVTLRDPSLGFVFPFVTGVVLAPTKIDPGNSLGIRASVSITLRDSTFSDIGIDPYVLGRGYEPGAYGTFWGRWLARNKFVVGRPLRVFDGFLEEDGSYDAANFREYVYVIDTIEGPDPDGNVTIVGKDVLKLADNKNSQAPVPNSGALLAAIDDAETSLTLAPAGIGATYAASGTLIVGSEIMTFTRSSDVCTVTRAQRGTIAATHAVNDKVQTCATWDGQQPQAVIRDLLVNYSAVDASFIDDAQWDDEVNTWIPDFRIGTVLTKPTGVAALLNEICEQALVYPWYDERDQTIKLRAIRPATFEESIHVDETKIIKGTAKASQDNGKRITRVYVAFGVRDYTNNLDKDFNYAGGELAIDGDAESSDEYGNIAIKTIYSRWIQAGDSVNAGLLALRLLNRYRDALVELTFNLDVRDTDAWTGDYLSVSSRQIQDPTGASSPVIMQVLQVTPKPNGVFEYVALASDFSGRFAFYAEDSAPDFADATDEEKATIGFFCDDTDHMPDGTDPYQYF